MAEFYATGTNRVVYRSVGFATGLTVTAYIWSPTLVRSALEAFTEVELGLYYLDYNFAVSGTYMGTFYENDVAKASGVFRVSTIGGGDATEIKQNAIISALTTVQEDLDDPDQYKGKAHIKL